MSPAAESHVSDIQTSPSTATDPLARFEAVIIVIALAAFATSAGVFCLGFVPDLLG